MILTCPNCGTQYVVKDGAIPPEGRQVRCAACKHSWHQDLEVADIAEAGSEAAVQPGQLAEAEPVETREEVSGEDESLVESTLIEPRSGPEAEERAYEEAVIDGEVDTPVAEAPAASVAAADVAQSDVAEAPPPQEDWKEPPDAEPAPDMFSPFAENGEVEPRRRSPILSIAVIVLIVVVAAALFWLFAPADLKAKLGIAAAGATPLQLVTTHMDRQPLESGNELLTVTGRVINPSAKEQDVPPIRAQLKNKAGKIVYSWTIQPPARSIPAGGSASFNSAEVNVPPGGDELTITLGEPKV